MNISAAVEQLAKFRLNPVYFGDDFGGGERRIICFLKIAENVADRFSIYQQDNRWRAAVLLPFTAETVIVEADDLSTVVDYVCNFYEVWLDRNNDDLPLAEVMGLLRSQGFLLKLSEYNIQIQTSGEASKPEYIIIRHAGGWMAFHVDSITESQIISFTKRISTAAENVIKHYQEHPP